MRPLIALDRINVHLAGRHVLKDVSFALETGQHWAVVGPNGSGKSTLLRVLAGTQWIDHDGGRRTYSLDGESVDATGRAATHIRFVSAEQHERYARLDLALPGRAVIESGFDDSLYVHRALDAAQRARVAALIEQFDVHAFVDRPVQALSSGQLRRLLIARALAREPRVLVLDEFTNGLDASARGAVVALLDRIAASVTLVIASHRGADFPAALTHTATLVDGCLTSALAGRPEGAPMPPAPPAASVDDTGDVLVNIRGADVYRGTTLVLRDLTWQLRRGEHTAIRGSNGAGKTTLAGLIAGTIPAATGAYVERFGQTGPFDLWRLKERIAHVSDDLQIAYHLRETVAAVVASGFPASIGLFIEPTAEQSAIVAQTLERMGLAALRTRPFNELSFGERRKVLIARSLVRRPEIFIIDEIWNGLDRTFRDALRRLLADMTRCGTTLVAIAHDDDELAGLATRTYTLRDGRLQP